VKTTFRKFPAAYDLHWPSFFSSLFPLSVRRSKIEGASEVVSILFSPLRSCRGILRFSFFVHGRRNWADVMVALQSSPFFHASLIRICRTTSLLFSPPGVNEKSKDAAPAAQDEGSFFSFFFPCGLIGFRADAHGPFFFHVSSLSFLYICMRKRR